MTKNNEIKTYSKVFRTVIAETLENYVSEYSIMKALEREFKVFIRELKK